MRTLRRAVAALPAVPAAIAGVFVAQVLKAAKRPDLPSFPNQDPSGRFGDPSSPELLIVALGDSSITGPGVTDLDNIWVRRIAIELSRTLHVELMSLAVGGAKARDVIEGQLAEAVRLKPDLALISVGANDAIRATPPARYRAELRHILTDLEGVARSMMVLGVGDLGSIPRLPRMLRAISSRRSARFDAAAAAVVSAFPTAVKGATSGPMSTAFWSDPSLFAGDQFHAGDAGHAVFAEQAMPAVRAALRIAGTPAI